MPWLRKLLVSIYQAELWAGKVLNSWFYRGESHEISMVGRCRRWCPGALLTWMVVSESEGQSRGIDHEGDYSAVPCHPAHTRTQKSYNRNLNDHPNGFCPCLFSQNFPWSPWNVDTNHTVLKWKRGLKVQHAIMENKTDPKSLRVFGPSFNTLYIRVFCFIFFKSVRAELLVPQLLCSEHDRLELEYHSIIQTLHAADHLSVPMRCWWLRCLYATDERINSASTGFLLDSKAKVIKLTALCLSSLPMIIMSTLLCFPPSSWE